VHRPPANRANEAAGPPGRLLEDGGDQLLADEDEPGDRATRHVTRTRQAGRSSTPGPRYSTTSRVRRTAAAMPRRVTTAVTANPSTAGGDRSRRSRKPNRVVLPRTRSWAAMAGTRQGSTSRLASSRWRER